MRIPKPFFRKQTQSWYVQIGKKQVNLGRDEQDAWDQYHKIMAQRDSVDVPDDAVCNLLNHYLGWLKKNRAEATYKKCRFHLRKFAQYIGRRLRVRKLKRHLVARWVEQDYGEKSTTYQNEAMSAIVTALNWAVDMEFIDRNPIDRIRKPQRKMREFFLRPEQWSDLLKAIPDQPFNDFIRFMLITGARPQEARAIESRHYVAKDQRIEFSRYESKGKRRQRVIYLSDESQQIVERWSARYTEGPIFRNRCGNPWTKNAMNCRFKRLKKKLGMPELCAYTCRHSFAHWKLISGVDINLVAKLMRHVDSRMIETRYGHVEQNPEFMLQQAQIGDLPHLPTVGALPVTAPDAAADLL
ncbi:MAG: site-specific integrase, partial [Planctomycetota bacterium]